MYERSSRRTLLELHQQQSTASPLHDTSSCHGCACLSSGCSFLFYAGVELKNVKMSMNPFCENAMEEAVRLKVRNDLKYW